MRRFSLTIDGAEYKIEVSKDALVVNGRPFTVEAGLGTVVVDGIRYSIEIKNDTAWVDGFPYAFVFRDGQDASVPRGPLVEQAADAVSSPISGDGQGGYRVASAMPGKVVRMLVKEGDAVEIGDVVCILEAMKMENELRTEQSGIVRKVLATAGQNVEAGEPLVILE